MPPVLHPYQRRAPQRKSDLDGKLLAAPPEELDQDGNLLAFEIRASACAAAAAAAAAAVAAAVCVLLVVAFTTNAKHPLAVAC